MTMSQGLSSGSYDGGSVLGLIYSEDIHGLDYVSSSSSSLLMF